MPWTIFPALPAVISMCSNIRQRILKKITPFRAPAVQCLFKPYSPYSKMFVINTKSRLSQTTTIGWVKIVHHLDILLLGPQTGAPGGCVEIYLVGMNVFLSLLNRDCI